MTRESGPLTKAGTPENSVVPEAPPPTVRLQISAAKKLNLAAFQNAVPALHELVIVNETSSLISDLTVPWLSERDRQEIGSFAEKAVVAQNKGNELESAAVALLEEKIRKES